MEHQEERKGELPQEEIDAIMKVIRKQEQANYEIASLSEAVPEALMNEATRKIKEVTEFNEEIEVDVAELVKRQQKIKDKFAKKLYEERNLKGYLTHSLESYHSCLGDIDKLQL